MHLPTTKPGITLPRVAKETRRIIHSPQFPGGQEGATIKAVQEFIRQQRRVTGIRISGGIGTQEFRVEISGTAQFLLGINFGNSIDDGTDFTFIVNNETIIDSVMVELFTQNNNKGYIDYYPLNRPLSGTDQIKLLVNSTIAYENIPFAVYYI